MCLTPTYYSSLLCLSEQVTVTDVFGDKFWQGQPTPPRLGVMAGLLQVHKVVVNSVVGEDEIMERNILNVVKGQLSTYFISALVG